MRRRVETATLAPMNDSIQVEEVTDVDPLCPHCEHAIRRVLVKRVEAFLGVRLLYFCPDCRKVLGISHRKGFWMG